MNSLGRCLGLDVWKYSRYCVNIMAYLIFVILSPRAQFLAKFFSTQKRVNCTKTDFATKQRKLQKTDLATKYCKMQQNTINCTHYFSTFQILFTFLMWRFFPHDNLSCGEFLHLTICYMDNFLHMTIFFLHGHCPWCP